MTWAASDPTPLALRAAIERAYAVFSRYSFGGPLIHCPDCLTEEEVAVIRARPLRELSPLVTLHGGATRDRLEAAFFAAESDPARELLSRAVDGLI